MAFMKQNSFFYNQVNLAPLSTDTIRWKKIGINKFGEIAIQYMNDSVVYRSIKVDTGTKSLALSHWKDSTFKSTINYTASTPDSYMFEGTYKNDAIRFSSRKIDVQNYKLIKNKGKVKWVWW